MEDQELKKIKNISEYLKIFFRRKWLIIAPAFIGLVLAIVACFVLPPTYESNTLIMVEEEKIINPLIEGLAVSTSTAQRMDAIKERLLGWNSLVDLTKKLKLDEGIQAQGQLEQLIARLKRNISVSMRGSNMVRIAFQSENPQKAQLVAKTLTEILVEENKRSQTKETGVAIDFIKEQLEVYKRKIKDSEIAHIEEQLNALLVDSTEQHPMVKELRQKIQVAQKELETGDFKVAKPEHSITGPAYDALKQELDKMINKETSTASASGVAYAANNVETNNPANSLYKLALVDKIDSVLARDISVNESIYNLLLQKLETAKITERLEASKEGTRYTVIDPPQLPLRPIKPNKIKLVLVGLMLGSLSGAGMVFGKEFMDHSFLDIEDAKETLELPILGAISRLTTQEEIDKEKHIKKRLITIGLIVSAALIIIAALISPLFRK